MRLYFLAAICLMNTLGSQPKTGGLSHRMKRLKSRIPRRKSATRKRRLTGTRIPAANGSKVENPRTGNATGRMEKLVKEQNGDSPLKKQSSDSNRVMKAKKSRRFSRLGMLGLLATGSLLALEGGLQASERGYLDGLNGVSGLRTVPGMNLVTRGIDQVSSLAYDYGVHDTVVKHLETNNPQDWVQKRFVNPLKHEEDRLIGKYKDNFKDSYDSKTLSMRDVAGSALRGRTSEDVSGALNEISKMEEKTSRTIAGKDVEVAGKNLLKLANALVRKHSRGSGGSKYVESLKEKVDKLEDEGSDKIEKGVLQNLIAKEEKRISEESFSHHLHQAHMKGISEYQDADDENSLRDRVAAFDEISKLIPVNLKNQLSETGLTALIDKNLAEYKGMDIKSLTEALEKVQVEKTGEEAIVATGVLKTLMEKERLGTVAYTKRVGEMNKVNSAVDIAIRTSGISSRTIGNVLVSALTDEEMKRPVLKSVQDMFPPASAAVEWRGGDIPKFKMLYYAVRDEISSLIEEKEQKEQISILEEEISDSKLVASDDKYFAEKLKSGLRIAFAEQKLNELLEEKGKADEVSSDGIKPIETGNSLLSNLKGFFGISA